MLFAHSYSLAGNPEQGKRKLRNESCSTLPMSLVERLLKSEKSRIWSLLPTPYSRVSVVPKLCEITILLVMANISKFSSTHRANQSELISQIISWKRIVLLDKSSMNAISTSFINSLKPPLKITEVFHLNHRKLKIRSIWSAASRSLSLYFPLQMLQCGWYQRHGGFATTIQAMNTIGLSQQEIDDIFKILAAILWLGNVQFVENNEGNAAIADDSVPTYLPYLMDVDGSSVNKVYLT